MTRSDLVIVVVVTTAGEGVVFVAAATTACWLLRVNLFFKGGLEGVVVIVLEVEIEVSATSSVRRRFFSGVPILIIFN